MTNTQNIYQKVEEYLNYKRIIEEATEAAESLKCEIRETLRESGQTTLYIGTHKIQEIVVSTCRIDTKSMEQDHSDLVSQYKKPSSYTKLLIG